MLKLNLQHICNPSGSPIEKLKVTFGENLQSVMEWLQDRKFPKEGEHFKINIITHTIGDWNLKWYEIQTYQWRLCRLTCFLAISDT